MWVNDTRMQAAAQGLTAGQAAPGINRWNTAINLATNTYLNFLQVSVSAQPARSSHLNGIEHTQGRAPSGSRDWPEGLSMSGM